MGRRIGGWKEGRIKEGAESDRGVYGGCVVMEMVPDRRPGWMWRGSGGTVFPVREPAPQYDKVYGRLIQGGGGVLPGDRGAREVHADRGRDNEDRKGGDENQLLATHQCYGAVGDGYDGVFDDRDQKR